MKIKIVFLTCLLTASISSAWEFPRNPDRFPSIGINATTSRLTGERRTGTDLPDTAFQRVQADSGSMDYETTGLDLRLPVCDVVTFTASYDRVDYNSNLTRSGDIFKSSDNFNGNRFGIGLRIYLSN